MNEDLLMATLLWLSGFIAGGLATAAVVLMWIDDLVSFVRRRR